jgi:hypothetical protein
MDAFAQFINYLQTKLQEIPTISDPRNVIVGETISLLDLPEEAFPRIEILITKLKGQDFIDQRNLQQGFRFSLAGFLKRTGFNAQNVSSDDMFQSMRFGREILKVVLDTHTAVISGEPICDGFLQISGYPEISFEYEMFDEITTCIVSAEAEVMLPDNYL